MANLSNPATISWKHIEDWSSKGSPASPAVARQVALAQKLRRSDVENIGTASGVFGASQPTDEAGDDLEGWERGRQASQSSTPNATTTSQPSTFLSDTDHRQVHAIPAQDKTPLEIRESLHLNPQTVRTYLRMPIFAAHSRGRTSPVYRAYLDAREPQGKSWSKSVWSFVHL
jgi:hypothetical protein